MQPERFVTCGLVLRETVTRDADKILTVLTLDRGRLSVIARGARRKGSRVAAACQLLAYSEMTLYERGRWTMLDAADTIDVLPLLLNALYALSALKKPPQLVKPAFQFRLMALAGYEPMADGCALCGAPQPENPMLDVVHGVVHCGKCREKGGLSLPLTASGLAALRYVLYGDPRRLYSFSLPPEGLRALNHAADAYVSAQLERSFRTLDYYKTILPQEETKYE